MKGDELNEIRNCARWFREILEECPKSLLPITFESFPRGSCGDASLLLGKYIQQSNLGTFDYVCGEFRDYGNFQSHAWLEKNGLIVDITADQFEEITLPVIVTKDRSWYERFEVAHRHIADYDIYDGFTRASLSYAYHNVLDWANKSAKRRVKNKINNKIY